MEKTRELLEYDYSMLRLLYSQGIIKIMVLFFIVQLFLIYIDVTIYIVSIYGPLVYYYIKYTNHSRPHLPMSLFKHLVAYILVVLLSVFDISYFFLSLMLVYTIVYTILINLELRKQDIAVFEHYKQVINVYKIFIALAIGINILCLWELYFEDKRGELLSHIIFMEMLVVNILFSLTVLFLLDRDEKRLRIQKSNLQLSKLAIEILVFFKTSEVYLNPNFNIKDLALILNAKKEDISKVINREYKMNFYVLVAKYRIDYAKQKLLISEETIDMRLLLEQCGFNSHSVFYKYFRLFEGIEPAEYKKKHFVHKAGV